MNTTNNQFLAVFKAFVEIFSNIQSKIRQISKLKLNLSTFVRKFV